MERWIKSETDVWINIGTASNAFTYNRGGAYAKPHAVLIYHGSEESIFKTFKSEEEAEECLLKEVLNK